VEGICGIALFNIPFSIKQWKNNTLLKPRPEDLFFLFIIGYFIACIGLLGLAAYAASSECARIISEVLGASAGNIVGMLSKDFMNLC
jgi:putative ABC transport system permease protein